MKANITFAICVLRFDYVFAPRCLVYISRIIKCILVVCPAVLWNKAPSTNERTNQQTYNRNANFARATVSVSFAFANWNVVILIERKEIPNWFVSHFFALISAAKWFGEFDTWLFTNRPFHFPSHFAHKHTSFRTYDFITVNYRRWILVKSQFAFRRLAIYTIIATLIWFEPLPFVWNTFNVSTMRIFAEIL